MNFTTLSKYNKLSQLKKNVLSGSVLAGGSITILLLSYPLYLNYLGTKLYGLWATISVVMTLSQLGNLGINNAIIKYTAEEYGKGNLKAITEYLVTSLYILVVPSAIMISAFFIYESQIVGFLNLEKTYEQEALVLVPYVATLSAFVFFANLIKGTLIGIGRADLSNYISLGGKFLQLGASIILIIYGLGVWGLFWGSVLFHLFTSLLSAAILIIKYKIKIFSLFGFCGDRFKKLLTFGGTLFSAQIISMLMNPFNKVIISKYIGLSEVTYYDIALNGALQLRSIYEMGLKAIMPKVSEIKEKLSYVGGRIRQIHYKGMKFVIAGGTPAFLLIFLLSPLMLKMWLGKNFNEQIVTGLRIFLVSYYVNLLCVPAYYIFMGLNRIKICFNCVAIQSLLNVCTILLLVALNLKMNLCTIFLINGSSLVIAAVYVLLKFKYHTWTTENASTT